MLGHHNYTNGTYPPHVYLAMQKPLLIEPILTTVNENNVRDYINEYEIIISADIENDSNKLLEWFKERIADYERVFSRPLNLEKPQFGANETREYVTSTLEQYTDKELYMFYEDLLMKDKRHFFRGMQRASFIYNVVSLHIDEKWSVYRKSDCKNDSYMNIITGETRREIDKHDPNDPTISYGVIQYYRCYQVSELERSFRFIDEQFKFLNPDYNPHEQVIDPLTNMPVTEEFPLKAIKDLTIFIELMSPYYLERDFIRRFDSLYSTIQRGLKFKKRSNPIAEVQNSLMMFDNFSEDQKFRAELYLTWLFFYSMYMRFWRGPGTPYPIKNITKGESDDSCLPTTRDENIFIQQGVQNVILKDLDKETVNWLHNLNIINYDNKNKNFTPEKEKLIKLLNEVYYGTQCMGYAADIIFATSYYFINYIFNVDINVLLDKHLERLLEIERKLIPSLIEETNGLPDTYEEDKEYKRNRMNILEERIKYLEGEIVHNYKFTLEGLTKNVHV